jgi:yopX protein
MNKIENNIEKISTGIFDEFGVEIFVGDLVWYDTGARHIGDYYGEYEGTGVVKFIDDTFTVNKYALEELYSIEVLDENNE